MGPESTRWSMIRGAAEGRAQERAAFVSRYASVVRASLSARWRDSPLRAEIDDAVQDVFLECFKIHGALERAREGTPSGFRGYLYGVVLNVARRVEETRRTRRNRHQTGVDVGGIEAAEPSLSGAFDRAWASALIREAAELQAELAAASGPEAVRRVELLRLRFGACEPIREIAKRWGADPARVHTEYAQARVEFKRALTSIVKEHHPARSVDAECERILELFGD